MTNLTNLTYLTPSDAACAEIYAHVSARIQVLYKGIEYRSEQLCGEDYWVMLGDGKQRQAGKCIRKLAEIGLLPLVIVEKRHEYPLYFKIV
jgi:hypothetical protein